MRSLSPMETVVLVSVTGSLLAVFVPAFVRHLHASRLVEPLEGLERIARGATLFAREHGAYPESTPLSPKEVPAGRAEEDPPGTWDHPGWRALGFEFERAHRYAFAFDSKNGERGSEFQARAHGDLDGDGIFSTFRISGEIVRGQDPVVFPIEMDREVE